MIHLSIGNIFVNPGDAAKPNMSLVHVQLKQPRLSTHSQYSVKILNIVQMAKVIITKYIIMK